MKSLAKFRIGIRRRRGERGAVAIELALLMPMILALLFGVIEFGDALNAYISTVGAARDGARLAVRTSATDAEIKNAAIIDMGRLRDPTTAADVTVTRGKINGYDSVAVKVCHKHKLIFGFSTGEPKPWKLINLPDPMTLCSTTTMRNPL